MILASDFKIYGLQVQVLTLALSCKLFATHGHGLDAKGFQGNA